MDQIDRSATGTNAAQIMKPETHILIAGIGNIFFGDDAFGVEAARQLARYPLPDGVRVVDFGIRGLDLAYALLEPYQEVIFIDAVPRGGAPGTLYVLELECPTSSEQAPAMDTHNVDLGNVLRLAGELGTPLQRFYLVGCEPQPPAAEDEMVMEMSEAVQAAVDEAVPLIASLAAKLLRGETITASTAPSCGDQGPNQT
jgi:hydrogenase maturation protease